MAKGQHKSNHEKKKPKQDKKKAPPPPASPFAASSPHPAIPPRRAYPRSAADVFPERAGKSLLRRRLR